MTSLDSDNICTKLFKYEKKHFFWDGPPQNYVQKPEYAKHIQPINIMRNTDSPKYDFAVT